MKLALAMIVKDEADKVTRCLDSVLGVVDHVSVIDTGSTDGTLAVMQEWCDRNDLQLVTKRMPWINFGTNRTQLLKWAGAYADWLLLLDADMELVLTHRGSVMRPETELRLRLEGRYHGIDAILVRYRGALDYQQPLLVRTKTQWRYEGVTHEFFNCPDERRARIDLLEIIHHQDPADGPVKLQRDLAMLRDYLSKHPGDARTEFYLARTYQQLGERQRAADLYDSRGMRGGFEEEAWHARYQAALIREDDPYIVFRDEREERDGYEPERRALELCSVFETRPTRAEPLYCAAGFFREAKHFQMARVVAELGLTVPYPSTDLLFIEKAVYDWGLLFERAIAAQLCGDGDTAHDDYARLLQRDDLPQDVIKAIVRNLGQL